MRGTRRKDRRPSRTKTCQDKNRIKKKAKTKTNIRLGRQSRLHK